MIHRVYFSLVCALGTIGSAFSEPSQTDPKIEASVQAVYPALVRIHVVSEDGGGGRMQKRRGSGSGTIIHPDGYILTNHHVAGRATRIMVRLSDRQEIRATLVGTDALSDLAVLKIDRKDLRDPDAPLPVARFGDSDRLKVGDVVLAMGSPAGISQSVTQGIVSNTEMISPVGSLRLDGEAVGELVRWIGHDAVIFPGNSGGPLVNLDGEIVGVNEVGIGSLGGAIPANLARKVADELIAHGSVRRSWTGLLLQPLLKTSPVKAGVLIGGVLEGSPADQAGLRAGDIVTECNGTPVTALAPEDLPIFNRLLLEIPVGSTVSLKGWHNGQPQHWEIVTSEREPAEPREMELLSWGITVRDLTNLAAQVLHRADNRAVVVQSVNPGGAAAAAKPAIRPGSLLLAVEGRPVANVEDLIRVSTELTEGKTEPEPVLVSYEQDGKNFLTVVRIGPQPEVDRPALARKAWMGVETQVISAELAEALGIAGAKGVRVTQLHPESEAEKAGLQLGDLILKLDGTELPTSRPEDSDVFPSLIRQYRIGTEATLTVRRGDTDVTIKVPLVESPESTAELASYNSETLEFTARDLGQADRVRDHLPESLQGVLITGTAPAGWATLAGLSSGDILLSIDGRTINSIETLKTEVENLEANKTSPFVLFVRRGVITRYIEMEPTW